MRRSSRTPDGEDQEPGLFDLPLEAERGARAAAASPAADAAKPRATAPRQPKERPPAPSAPRSVPKPAPMRQVEKEPETGTAEREPFASLKSRFMAGLADLLVHAAIAVAAVAGSRLLGVRPRPADWPAVALFLLTFSFLYTVLPLAFWGQTLGMAWAGLIGRSRDGEALTFDQTARRWFGALVTTATLGIPLFVTGRGRSLSDRLSASSTFSS